MNVLQPVKHPSNDLLALYSHRALRILRGFAETEASLVAAAITFLRELASYQPDTVEAVRSPDALSARQARRITSYIDANIARRIRIPELSELVGSSVSHLNRAFRKHFGMPPLTYINLRRIAMAQQLMLNSDMPLSEIALECGLCDQAHLSRLFHRIVGDTPSRWRRLCPNTPALQAGPEVKANLYSLGTPT